MDRDIFIQLQLEFQQLSKITSNLSSNMLRLQSS